MSERLYPVVLAAVSESKVRLKWIKNEREYSEFYCTHDKPGTEFREMKTIRTIFKVAESKIIDPDYFNLDF